MNHYVYIIRSLTDGTLYKGYSTNFEKRADEHNAGMSNYTSRKTPWELVYAELCLSKSVALIREKQLKRANKNYLNWLHQSAV